jgi:hypothetical protein
LGDFVTNLAGTDLWFNQLQPLVYPTWSQGPKWTIFCW